MAFGPGVPGAFYGIPGAVVLRGGRGLSGGRMVGVGEAS